MVKFNWYGPYVGTIDLIPRLYISRSKYMSYKTDRKEHEDGSYTIKRTSPKTEMLSYVIGVSWLGLFTASLRYEKVINTVN